VPMEGPAGEPILDLVLEGGSLTVRAKLNGKNFLKLLKQVDEHGAENVAVALQGVLRPPAAPGGPFVLEGRGSRRWSRRRDRPRPSRPTRPESRRRAEPEPMAGEHHAAVEPATASSPHQRYLNLFLDVVPAS
jgi:hypothetical protein